MIADTIIQRVLDAQVNLQVTEARLAEADAAAERAQCEHSLAQVALRQAIGNEVSVRLEQMREGS